MAIDIHTFINNARMNPTVKRLCNVKKYLPINEKFNLIRDYYSTLSEWEDDEENKGFEDYISMVLFYLYVVKAYTNVDIELKKETFDLLQESSLITKIIEEIGEDFQSLLGLVKNYKE